MENEKPYVSILIGLIETNFISFKSLADINGGVEINKEVLSYSLQKASDEKRLVMNVLLLLFGYDDNKFISALIEIITLLNKNASLNLLETFKYFSLFALFNSASEDERISASLSDDLCLFFSDKGGTHSDVYYLCVFSYSFMEAIARYVYGIAKKYELTAASEKPKIQKLYSSKERIEILINSAHTNARDKIAQSVFLREVDGVMKKFIPRHKTLITVKDLFETNYDF